MQRLVEYREIATTSLRFALQVRRGYADALVGKKTLDIITSNPKSAKLCAEAAGAALRIVGTLGGSVEVSPKLYEKADGIIDLVDSGKTSADNGLEIAKDNLLPVTLGAVWLNENYAPEVETAFDGTDLAQAIAKIERRVREVLDEGKIESYTHRLANPQRALGKLNEEYEELVEAFSEGSPQAVAAETADVLYAAAIVNALRGTSLLEALKILAARNLR